jgi:hypothetical protein
MPEATIETAAPPQPRCAECETPLAEGQDRETTENGTFCRPCFNNLTSQLRQALDAQGRDVNYTQALVGGLLGGAAGVLVWWGFTVFTKVAFGLVAVVIGFTVGKGIVLLSGGKRSRSLQGLSVAIALLAYVYASYLVTRTFLLAQVAAQGLTLPLVPGPELLLRVVQAGFSIMDLVFAAIVVYEAWKIPAPLRLAS